MDLTHNTSMPTETAAFLLTVPHKTCPAHGHGPHHLCDFLAERAAAALRDKLRARGAEVAEPLLGDVCRATLDLNRAESRWSRWRRKVADGIAELGATGSPVFVVDVHSYGGFAEWSERAIEAGRPAPNLVFLDERDGRGIPRALRTRLSPRLAALTDVGGSSVNDVVATARENGAAWAVLIEFDEDAAAGDPRWLPQTADAVAEALVSYARDAIGKP